VDSFSLLFSLELEYIFEKDFVAVAEVVVVVTEEVVMEAVTGVVVIMEAVTEVAVMEEEDILVHTGATRAEGVATGAIGLIGHIGHIGRGLTSPRIIIIRPLGISKQDSSLFCLWRNLLIAGLKYPAAGGKRAFLNARCS
jgi:hypothetical protein